MNIEFVADDGMRFNTRDECAIYEENMHRNDIDFIDTIEITMPWFIPGEVEKAYYVRDKKEYDTIFKYYKLEHEDNYDGIGWYLVITDEDGFNDFDIFIISLKSYTTEYNRFINEFGPYTKEI